MIIVVDTNILISAIMSPSSKIAEILFSPFANIELISSRYALDEISEHEEKIAKSSKLLLSDVRKAVQALARQIEFFDENIIELIHWQEADRLTSGVDAKDINFVALTLQTGGLLWTGDKKLTTHLRTLDFKRVINARELREMFGF